MLDNHPVLYTIRILTLSWVNIMILSSCSLIQVGQEIAWYKPLTTHTITEIQGLEQVWVKSDVFARQDDLRSVITASQGTIYMLGGLNENDRSGITALDARSGELLWQKGYGYKSAIWATSSALYVGVGGGATISKYDLKTGDIDWSKSIPNTRGFIYLYGNIDENEIYTVCDPDKFFILDAETGEIKHQVKGTGIFLSTPDVTYVRSEISSIIQAVQTDTWKLLWEVNVKDEVLQLPAFALGRIYLRTGRTLGSVYVLDGQTGQIQWNTRNEVVSNVSVVDNEVYMLTYDGKLIGVDAQSGTLKRLVQFDPAQFILNGEANVGGYDVFHDPKTGLLFAHLGDSAQMYAFKITNE